MPDAPKNGKMIALDPNMVLQPKQTFGQRLKDGVRYIVADVKPNTWFGPAQPIAPVTDDPSARGRRFDYPVGYNIQTAPRLETGVSFDTLRNLADAHDITRICIETRKDQVARLPWDIRMKDKKAKPDEATIKKVKALMECPDGLNPMMTWVRQVVEEVLVTDALTAEPRKNLRGELARIDLISGSTIKPILDANGRVPEAPSPAYQQVLHGVPTGDFTRDELVYFMRNPRTHKVYGFSPVEQIILRVNTALRRDIKTLQTFTEGNVPAGIGFLPPDWTADQIKLFNEYFNSILLGNTAAQNRLLFMPGGPGQNFFEMNKVDLKDKFDEWLARVVCFCFSIPPTAFVSDTNRATADEQGEVSLEEGLSPLLLFLEGFINHILLKWGGFTEVEFKFNAEGAVDSLAEAQADDYGVRNGTKSIDEVRQKNGQDAIGIGHGIVTATGWVPLPTKENIAAGLIPDPVEVEARKQQLAEELGGGKKPVEEDKPGAKGAAKKPEDDPEPEPPKPTEKVEKKKTIVVKFQPDSYAPETLASLRGTIAHFLNAQGKRNARRMGAVYEKVTKSAEGDRVQAILDAVDVDAFEFLLDPASKAMTEAAKHAGRANVLAMQNMPGADSDIWGQVNAGAVEYGKRRGAQLVGKKWVDGELVDNPNAKWAITESTKDMLRSVTQDAIENGLTSAEFQKQIELSEAFSASRAQTIARTELSKAAAQGQREAWSASGLTVKKRSILSSTHSGEDECDTNAAQGWLAFDEAFGSGDQESPFHPRCACDIQYEAKSDEPTGDIEPEQV